MLSAGLKDKTSKAAANLKLMRRIGFYLFCISFPLPNWGFEGMGIGAFIMTPWAVSNFVSDLSQSMEWNTVVLATTFSMGWIANFSVLISLPIWARRTFVASPWLAFFSDVFLMKTDGSLDTGMLTFIPFYPWAIGITLIHYSHIRFSRMLNDLGDK